MDAITVKTFVLGGLSNNCYVIFGKESKKGFIVDAPEGIETVNVFIEKEEIEIGFLVLTHAHFDHIAGLENIKVPFYIHEKDMPLLKNADLNGSSFFQTSVSINKKPAILKDKAQLYFGAHKLEVIHTPGHTPGSISLYLGNLLFSGDTIFCNSIGRTDIPLASCDLLIKAIKERILTLPKETIIYPGHGPSTTVEEEIRNNPFLK
jgi:glyoxylase-like metal-dependent hydrolase (beta-lactamase superfamily II)